MRWWEWAGARRQGALKSAARGPGGAGGMAASWLRLESEPVGLANEVPFAAVEAVRSKGLGEHGAYWKCCEAYRDRPRSCSTMNRD